MKKDLLTNQSVKLNELSWTNVLTQYLNIQTVLLNKLKYSYLNDACLFFGSYYENMIRVSDQKVFEFFFYTQFN